MQTPTNIVQIVYNIFQQFSILSISLVTKHVTRQFSLISPRLQSFLISVHITNSPSIAGYLLYKIMRIKVMFSDHEKRLLPDIEKSVNGCRTQPPRIHYAIQPFSTSASPSFRENHVAGRSEDNLLAILRLPRYGHTCPGAMSLTLFAPCA